MAAPGAAMYCPNSTTRTPASGRLVCAIVLAPVSMSRSEAAMVVTNARAQQPSNSGLR
jgi:hypothetical protein